MLSHNIKGPLLIFWMKPSEFSAFDDQCNQFNDRLINMLTVVYYVGPQSAAEKEYREWAFGLWFSLVLQMSNTVSDREAV